MRLVMAVVELVVIMEGQQLGVKFLLQVQQLMFQFQQVMVVLVLGHEMKEIFLLELQMERF
jgi:hypothetical protein